MKYKGLKNFSKINYLPFFKWMQFGIHFNLIDTYAMYYVHIDAKPTRDCGLLTLTYPITQELFYNYFNIINTRGSYYSNWDMWNGVNLDINPWLHVVDTSFWRGIEMLSTPMYWLSFSESGNLDISCVILSPGLVVSLLLIR